MGIYGMAETITKGFELSCPLTFLIIKWVGIIWCLLFVGKIAWAIYKYCFRKPHDLFARYGGENSWAVVTGASDGIGLEYCRQLSQLGFNILMIARNRSKLEEKRVEILELCQGKIEVQIVEMDFNIQFSEESYAPVIEAIKEKPIAILVNNVGAVFAQNFHKFSEEKLLEMLNVNIESVTFMTRLILPGMVSRNPHKCGVICISDVLGQVPLPYAGTYASTKAFMSYFCNSLALEYKNTNIDFLNCLPGRVHTKLSPVKQICTQLCRKPLKANFAASDTIRRLSEIFSTLSIPSYFILNSCSVKPGIDSEQPFRMLLNLTQSIPKPSTQKSGSSRLSKKNNVTSFNVKMTSIRSSSNT